MDFTGFKCKTVDAGMHLSYFFPNGYGVTILKHNSSESKKAVIMWELSVMKGTEEKHKFCYGKHTMLFADEMEGPLPLEFCEEFVRVANFVTDMDWADHWSF